jgi:four helix bundle protein
MDQNKSLISIKSFAFALKIIDFYKKMHVQKEYVLSKQLLRSGTSIGANVVEATAAQSRKDFISKMSVASKEARETKYWLQLIQESKIVNIDVIGLLNENEEIIRILTSIVKTSTENLKATEN